MSIDCDRYGCFAVNGEIVPPGKKASEVLLSQAPEEFRSKVCGADGSAFPPESGRYRLYVGAGCPFAARAWNALSILQLEDVIEVVSVFPGNSASGWFFEPTTEEEDFFVSSHPGAVYDKDPEGYTHLHALYLKTAPKFSGKVTVPVLWDKQQKVIVSNNSLDISKYIAKEFAQFSPVKDKYNLWPADMDEQVAAMCAKVASEVNGKVYGAHFCPDQPTFEKLTHEIFASLDNFETTLGKQPYLLGESMTIADIMLYCSLIRFDLIYGPMFRLNVKSVKHDYPHLWQFTRTIYAQGGDKCFRARDVLRNYYLSKPMSDKKGRTVPLGPVDLGLA